MLASQSNKKFSDPESIKLEQTISELESSIMKKLDGIDQKLSCSLKTKYKTEEKKDV